MGNPAAEQSSSNSTTLASVPTGAGSGDSSKPVEDRAAGIASLTDRSVSSISAPALALIWLSVFALTNVTLFNLITRFTPGVAESFVGHAALAQVDGALALVMAALLVVGWAWFDIPAAWRSLTAGAVTMRLVRFLAVLAGAIGACSVASLSLGGAERALWAAQIFPLMSLVLAVHAYLCAWASRVVARSTGIRIEDRVGLINVVPCHGPVGTTEVHDKMVRLAELQCGDLIRLKRGHVAPCDVIVESGLAEVGEQRFSGFSELRFKGEGQRLFAGSEIRSGEVLARVENVFNDSIITNFTEVLDGVVRRNLVPERWESIAHAIVLFVAACAGIFFYRDGADAATVAGVVGATLTASLWIDLLVYLPLLRGVAITRGFERGILCGEPHHLDRVGEIKSFVLDHAPGHTIDRSMIADFTVFDERLDAAQLISALLSILGRSNDPFGLAAVGFLRGRVDEPMLFEVRDFIEYEGKGLSAVVAGAEFSIGSEMFLIERGVQLQISEVDEGGEGELVYVALGDEVAARFTVHGALRHESPEAFDLLHRFGVRAMLMTQAPREVADVVGKEMNLELAQITGGLSVEQYVDRLTNVAPAALVCTPGTPVEAARAAAVRLMNFDEVRFHLDPKAVTIFRSGIAPLVEAYDLGRRLVRALALGRWGGMALAAVTLAVALYTRNPLVGVVLALIAPLYFAAAVGYLRRAGSPG